MAILFTNNAATTLASGITNVATTLTVASGQGALFPNPTAVDYFLCTLENTAGTSREIVKVTARSTDVFTIVRAQEGTTGTAFSTGDKVELRLTAGVAQSAANAVGAQGLYENSNTISANYTITSGNNAVSAGPITVNSGVTVTVPSTSTWTIV
jgi:hypothetical protein